MQAENVQVSFWRVGEKVVETANFDDSARATGHTAPGDHLVEELLTVGLFLWIIDYRDKVNLP